jgi:hypothetical protein
MPGSRCPVPGANCAELKRGAALLTLCVYAVSCSRVLLGGDFFVLVNAALNGNLSPLPLLLLAGWVYLLWIGGGAAWAGWRSARTHVDPLNPAALALAVATGLFSFSAVAGQWHVPVDWFGLWRLTGLWVAVASRGLCFAALAYNLAGVWLQVRGPVAHLLEAPPAPPPPWPEPPRWQPPPPQWWQEPPSPLWDVPPPSPPPADAARYEEIIAAVARKADEDAHALAVTIAILTDERDRLLADFDFAKAALERSNRDAAANRALAARARDLETALAFPGALKAARKAARVALHPDRGGSTQQFQAAEALFDRIEKRTRP